MHACISHRQPIIDFLSRQCYDVMLADRTGNNVMHYAAGGGNDFLVESLLGFPGIGRALCVLNFHGEAEYWTDPWS